MDHFYTAVEERERPETKGSARHRWFQIQRKGKAEAAYPPATMKPELLVLARGFLFREAWRLCPRAVYLPPNFPLLH